ncbi:MAG: alpha/beta fold hydrolase [Acidimicrobiia bacterium]|nr:alpha/beta fold hydrolase [Acidimicrobiia bacterium]
MRRASSANRALNPRNQHAVAVIATGDRSQQLRQLDVPTLVVHGDGDLAIAPDGGEALARLIPDAELLRLPGAGHRPIDEKLIALTEAVVGRARRAADAA